MTKRSVVSMSYLISPERLTVFVRVFEQRFELSFREVFETQIYSWWDTRTQVLFSEVIRMHKFR